MLYACFILARCLLDRVNVVAYYWRAGSPFAVNVRSAAHSDASKLHVSGPGIRDGLLATFCSHFAIDTTDAGCGQLNVTVRGPKGVSTPTRFNHQHNSDHAHGAVLQPSGCLAPVRRR